MKAAAAERSDEEDKQDGQDEEDEVQEQSSEEDTAHEEPCSDSNPDKLYFHTC